MPELVNKAENTSGELFLRGAFRTLSNIYDGNFLEKYFTVFRGMALRKSQQDCNQSIISVCKKEIFIVVCNRHSSFNLNAKFSEKLKTFTN